jgi:hypothetical protein
VTVSSPDTRVAPIGKTSAAPYPADLTARAPKSATVLHAVLPHYGLSGALCSPQLFAGVAHQSGIDPTQSDRELLKALFERTSSFDGPWFASAKAHGLSVPVDSKTSTPLRQRSTIVGDVILIEQEGESSYYVCQSEAWSLVDGALVSRIDD